MDILFHMTSGVYGQSTLAGANLHLLWWFVAAGAAFIVGHALSVPILHRRQAQVLSRKRRH